MRNYQLPSRYEPMNQISDLFSNFDIIKNAMRPEARNEIIIEKTKKAIKAGLNDAAINYFWNLTINDLYLKIIAYGIEYFTSAINWESKKSLKNIDDLREVKDHDIIEGCYKLGILSSESYFFIQQCRDIRNNFSTAHLPLGEIDLIETANFVKNCIKYVLTFDPPQQGIKIKDLIYFMNNQNCNEDTESLILQQAPKVWSAILYSIFEEFIKQDCSSMFKSNTKKIAPLLWENITEDIKSSFGQKFVKLKAIADQDLANEAFSFLKIVNGLPYVPEDSLFIIFEKASKRLIDAHLGWNNFYKESSCAEELLLLGKSIPKQAVKQYVKAILLSYNGNFYGIARSAQEYNVSMINSFSAATIRQIFILLKTDKDVIRDLIYLKPCERLKELMKLIKEKSMIPEHKTIYEYITNSDIIKLSKDYRKNYDDLLESEDIRN